ncbi:MAG: hydroxyacylglutathione hydrolase [Legionella sp.]
MLIIPLLSFKDNYIWCLANQHSFVCVDPGEAESVIKFSEQYQLQLTAIFITHHHDDHITGISELRKKFPQIRVYGPADKRITGLTDIVSEKNIVYMEPYAFNILETPGHTSSHICYYEANTCWLWCGDTLFSAGCGRVFDGNMKQLFNSLQRLKTLPDHTQIFCGHEYTRQNLLFAATIEPNNRAIKRHQEKLALSNDCSLPSTLALEKAINPFLRTNKPNIKEFAQTNNIDSNDEFAIFVYLRTLKDQFKLNTLNL